MTVIVNESDATSTQFRPEDRGHRIWQPGPVVGPQPPRFRPRCRGLCARRTRAGIGRARRFRHQGPRMADEADVICVLIPDDVIPTLGCRRVRTHWSSWRAVTRSHSGGRPDVRCRDGRATDARARGSAVLSRGGRLHHRGRGATRRDQDRESPRIGCCHGDRRASSGRDRDDPRPKRQSSTSESSRPSPLRSSGSASPSCR